MGCYSADDYLQQGHDLALKRDYRSAILLFDKEIKKKTKLKEAYIQRGLCYESINQIDSAINDYKILVSFDPTNTTALYYIGLCKYEQKQFNEAIVYYNKAIATKGGASTSDTSRSHFILDINNDGLLGNFAPFDVPSHDIFYQRGLAYYSSKQIKKAYEDFQNCIQQNYYVGQSYYMVGLCWLTAGKKDKACEAFKQGSFNGDSLATKELNETCKWNIVATFGAWK